MRVLSFASLLIKRRISPVVKVDSARWVVLPFSVPISLVLRVSSAGKTITYDIQSNYCMPFDTPAEAPNKPNTCGKEYTVGGTDPSSTPSSPGTPSCPSTTPSTPGTGQTGENTDETGDENVETITTVINGQTSTVIRTRTVFVSASRTASRIASGSASRSASAVAAAGGAEHNADRGDMWKLAGLASVVAVLISVDLV